MACDAIFVSKKMPQYDAYFRFVDADKLWMYYNIDRTVYMVQLLLKAQPAGLWVAQFDVDDPMDYEHYCDLNRLLGRGLKKDIGILYLGCF